jgi:hypothetical protein
MTYIRHESALCVRELLGCILLCRESRKQNENIKGYHRKDNAKTDSDGLMRLPVRDEQQQ